MQRVIVVGPPGSGKSTIAEAVASHLGVRRVELDGLFWQPGWSPIPDQALRERVAAATSGERWVLDGNYYSVTAHVSWPRADTIVWLDLPRRVTFRRVLWRTLRQLATRAELWPGTHQTAKRALALLRFAWAEHGKYGARYRRLHVAEGEGRHWVHLRSPREAAAWVAAFTTGTSCRRES